MTDRITLTADELRQWEAQTRCLCGIKRGGIAGAHPLCPMHRQFGPVVLVIEGDPGETLPCQLPGDHDDFSHPCWANTDGTGLIVVTFVAPQEWVNATGPCETCGGHRTIPADGAEWIDRPCPDCRDGRKRVELRATCPDLNCYAGWRCGCGRGVYHVADCGRPAPTCRACGNVGSVLVARATVDLGLVIAGKDDWDGGGIVYDVEHLWLYDGGSSTGGFQLTLDPLPVPGRDFIVVLSEIELP